MGLARTILYKLLDEKTDIEKANLRASQRLARAAEKEVSLKAQALDLERRRVEALEKLAASGRT